MLLAGNTDPEFSDTCSRVDRDFERRNCIVTTDSQLGVRQFIASLVGRKKKLLHCNPKAWRED